VSNDLYIEDIFCRFFISTIKDNHDLSDDFSAAHNFYDILIDHQSLTKKQSVYLLNILKKHHQYLIKIGYSQDLFSQNLKWKKPFRELEEIKKVWLAKDQTDILMYHFKFPYSFKQKFDNELLLKKNHRWWDNQDRVTKVKFKDINIVDTIEFCNQNDFEIDDSMISASLIIEEYWQNEEQIKPYSDIENDQVVLKNHCQEALEYWNTKRTGDIYQDLILAKIMAYHFKGAKDQDTIKKICSLDSNNFYIPDFKKFFDIYKKINTKVAIVLDRNSDPIEWISRFMDEMLEHGITNKDVIFCHREKNEKTSNINEWIKKNHLGGKIEDGKIFIFLHAPAKWFYKIIDQFKILVLNNIIPPTDQYLQHAINIMPIVLHTGSIKPTGMRDIKIEEM
jgi:hypothetical protein